MTDTVWHEATESRGCDRSPVEYEFAETDDPRILAVIQRDEDNQISELYDGDAINPIIYVNHSYGLSFEWVAGYDGGEAGLMQQAYDKWGWCKKARTWLWKKHGIAAENANGGYDRSGNWIVATSRAYLEHIGNTEMPETYDEAREDCKSIAQDVEWALDGYVYGAGYATNEARRLPGGEVDLTDGDWDITIECWGLVGTEYARRTALDFDYGTPTLPEMLPIEVSA
jgi:hypothetical protein